VKKVGNSDSHDDLAFMGYVFPKTSRLGVQRGEQQLSK